jgi:PAS domain-containing protein
MSDGREDDDALRNSDARFRLAVETLGEGVVITDVEDVIVYVNSRMAEISGCWSPRTRRPTARRRPCGCRASPSNTR